MNILLLGSGGREHALAWKMAQSPKCHQLFIAPGNAGTLQCGTNINLNPNDFQAIKAFVLEQHIQMVVVGPEEPLVKGVADFFAQDAALKQVNVIGPVAAGARLEGSKDFAKAFMQRHQIPTAAYRSFTRDTFSDGMAFLETLKPPYVLKADGLAAGKGVLICPNLEEAQQGLQELLIGQAFGQASDTVVIEAFLQGIEISVFVATDGKSWKLLPSAKDYKRIGEGDTGPNTGGMGAVSPVPFADDTFMQKVATQIIQPTIDGLQKDGIPYRGFIFIGLMNVEGDPFVIEYNVRLGDPETEVVIPRIQSDLVEMFELMGRQELSQYQLELSPDYAVTVMLVSGGYPGDYAKDKVIDMPITLEGSQVFFAGAQKANDSLRTAGGRVLAITSMDPSLEKAREKSLQNAEKINFEAKYYRKDIGLDLIS